MTLKILIVDDHQVLIDGIKALLQPEQNLQVGFEASSGTEALKIIENNDIDLVLLDINIPGMDGFEVCQKAKQLKPNLKILALTMYQEPGFITRMLKAGADGYLLKKTDQQELVHAIHQVVRGEKYYSREIASLLLDGLHNPHNIKPSTLLPTLTRREKETLKLIVGENTNEEIAKQLFISIHTVISHRRSLLRKLDAKNTAGLVKAAYELNLLD